jgi:YHS domain-containing protein
MNVEMTTAEFYSHYNGREYYFCSQNCKRAFDENPAEYENLDMMSRETGSSTPLMG